VDLLEEILGRNDKLLNIQVEAARTYQQWGASADPRLYGRAIRGARRNAKTGKNTIWGWGRLARLTAGKAKYKETFRESRLNISKCRYLQAMRTPNEKQAMLKRAKRSLTATLRAYKDIGGPTWTRKYDQLMKQIQMGLGEPPTGIADLLRAANAAGG